MPKTKETATTNTAGTTVEAPPVLVDVSAAAVVELPEDPKAPPVGALVGEVSDVAEEAADEVAPDARAPLTGMVVVTQLVEVGAV